MTTQELIDQVNNLLVNNITGDISAAELNTLITNIIQSSMDQSLGFQDQMLTASRTINFDSNTMQMDSVAQMKMVATVLPPLDEGNFDFQFQPANTTTPGFIARNGNGVDVFSVHGNGDVQLGPKQALGTLDRSLSINSGGFPKLKFGTAYNVNESAVISIARRQYAQLTSYNDNVFEFHQDFFWDGNSFPYRFHFTNPSIYYNSGADDSLEAGFMFFKDTAEDDNLQFAIKPDNSLEHRAHSSPTPERTGVIDGYIQFVSNTNFITHPKWRTSDGREISLFQQNLPSNPSTSEIANFLETLGLANLT